MATPYITIGCPTTGGGVVLEGDSSFLIEGIPIACVGHKASCPLHKTVSTIITGDQHMQIMGRPAARAGDGLSCGCKLLPKQSLVVGDNGGGLGNSSNNSQFINSTNMKFDEQLKIFFNSESSEIFKHLKYKVKIGEQYHEGKLDPEGKTKRFNTEKAESISEVELILDNVVYFHEL